MLLLVLLIAEVWSTIGCVHAAGQTELAWAYDVCTANDDGI